jgi:preprotein translocase SecE subunit
MAVDVKPEKVGTEGAEPGLLVPSVLGAIYVMAGLGLVFYLIPTIWSATIGQLIVEYINRGINFLLLSAAMLAAAIGVLVLGNRLIGSQKPGVRAGSFVVLLIVLLSSVIVYWIGRGIAGGQPLEQTDQGGLVTLGLALIGLVGGGVFLLSRTKPNEWLPEFEAQGWFSFKPYKRNQGQRVRRLTMLGILILAGCGIYTLLAYRTLETVGYRVPVEVEGRTETRFLNDWVVQIPFMAGPVTLLKDVRFTIPLLLMLAAVWFAYRLVNWPAFADFLIATEAEMIKVTWPTRKRLIQDTIVVLLIVFILTVLLFFIDLIWGSILSFIRVLPSADGVDRGVEEIYKEW